MSIMKENVAGVLTIQLDEREVEHDMPLYLRILVSIRESRARPPYRFTRVG